MLNMLGHATPNHSNVRKGAAERLIMVQDAEDFIEKVNRDQTRGVVQSQEREKMNQS